MHLHHRHGVCSIVPPYMLRAIAASGDATAVRAAQSTIAHDDAIRLLRARRAPGPFYTATGGTPAATATEAHKERTVYDAKHTMRLPGTSVRTEGAKASSDVAVNEAYDGTGATFDFYWEVFDATRSTTTDCRC